MPKAEKGYGQKRVLQQAPTHLVALPALGASRDGRVVADHARSHPVGGHLAKESERPLPLLADLGKRVSL